MQQPSDPIRRFYDTVAREYAERFGDELAHKPLDRELLNRFAGQVRECGVVYDLGCGPGQTTAFLQACGACVRGLDLSPELLHEARRRHPDIAFEQGDMLALPLANDSVAGLLAFYAIVHFTTDALHRAIAEMFRVLQPGGRLLLAFHIGDETIHVEEFLGHAVTLDFMLFRPRTVCAELERAGFITLEVIEREPHPDVEYPSRRAYIFTQKPLSSDTYNKGTGRAE